MTGPAALVGAVAGLAVLVALLPPGLAAAARLRVVLPREPEGPAGGVASAPRGRPGRRGRGAPGSDSGPDGGSPPGSRASWGSDAPAGSRSPRGSHRPAADRSTGPTWRAGLLPAVLAAAGAAVLLPPVLAPLALPLGVAVRRLALRREPATTRTDRLRAELDLPPVLDLLAACLAAGASLGEGLGAVGAVTSAPLRGPLLEAAAALDLGSPADQALAAWDREPALAGLGPALAAAVVGGTPLAGAVRRLADDRRARAAAAGLAAARRVGVQVVLPLGACFLPAFVLVGVVPVVAGVASRVAP